MNDTPEIERTLPRRGIDFNRKTHRRGRNCEVHVTRIYVSRYRRGEPVRICGSEKDAKPDVGIGFTCDGNREIPASYASRWRVKRVRMMIRVVERMMFEQNLPGKRARTKDAILRVAGHNIMAINRGTPKHDHVSGTVIRVRFRHRDGRNRRLLGRDR